ncbi:MAG: hypothetical protein ACLFPM_00415 [Candidatus Izemoplasmatales bacterium]
MELKTKDITKLKFNNQRFSLTNGNLFLLGILEEDALKDEPVFMAHDESVDKVLFNPLFTLIKANDQLLSPKFHTPISHLQTYQLEEDILYRSSVYLIDGVKITIESERFIDRDDALIYMQYRFKTNKPINLDFYHGFDDTKLHANHGVKSIKSKLHEITLKTSDDEYLVLQYHKNFRHINRNEPNQATEHYMIESQPNRTYTISKMIGYGPRVRRLKKLLKYKMNQSYKKVRNKHINFKKYQMKTLNRMTVVNNKKIDNLMKYVYRQHLNRFPRSLSLNQTGLENFTQIYFYLLNHPEMAKNVLLNQINNLKEYIKNAKILGFQGALLVDDLNDFLEGNRKIYEGALLIYLIDLYQEMTGDKSLIEEGGLEISIEITKFYLDYGVYNSNKKHIDFNNVSNLNQSLNHINNHTLTNYLIRHGVKLTKDWIKSNKKSKIIKSYSETDLNDFSKAISNLYRKIFILKPANKNLIYPYQNFLLDQEKDRLEKSDDSLTVFFDQLYLFILFNQDFSSKVISDNINYFSEYADQSKINQILLNLVSNDIIKDKDYTYFMNHLSINKESLLINKHGIDYGMIGFVYLFMTYRLSGLRYNHHNFTVDSLLPKEIRRLEYDIKYLQYIGAIKIKRNSARLEWNQ